MTEKLIYYLYLLILITKIDYWHSLMPPISLQSTKNFLHKKY